MASILLFLKSAFKKNDETEPNSVTDLRHRRLVTRVEYQGDTPFCQVFADLASIEAAYVTDGYGELRKWSVQQIIDLNYMNPFVGPPTLERALSLCPYITTDENYPRNDLNYKPDVFDKSKVKPPVVAVAKFRILKSTEEAFMAVLSMGYVISASIWIDEKDFHAANKDELYRGADSPNGWMNHRVAITGFGYTKSKEGFWICKNSWGVVWCDGGFIRIAHGKGPKGYGYCGILSNGRIPEFHEPERSHMWDTWASSLRVESLGH